MERMDIFYYIRITGQRNRDFWKSVVLNLCWNKSRLEAGNGKLLGNTALKSRLRHAFYAKCWFSIY